MAGMTKNKQVVRKKSVFLIQKVKMEFWQNKKILTGKEERTKTRPMHRLIIVLSCTTQQVLYNINKILLFPQNKRYLVENICTNHIQVTVIGVQIIWAVGQCDYRLIKFNPLINSLALLTCGSYLLLTFQYLTQKEESISYLKFQSVGRLSAAWTSGLLMLSWRLARCCFMTINMCADGMEVWC